MGLIDIDYFRRQPIGGKAITSLQTDILQEAIDEASEYVEDYLDMKIAATAWVQRIVGPREYILILDNYPVISVTDVSWQDALGNVGTHSLLDFIIHSKSGMLEIKDKTQYFRGDRVYIVSYSAGYTVIPGPIKRAVALQTVQILRPMYGGPQDAGSVDVIPFADEMITNLLEKYRRKRLS